MTIKDLFELLKARIKEARSFSGNERVLLSVYEAEAIAEELYRLQELET